VPILGYLDDLIIVPIGLWLAIRLIPPDILAEHRAAAERAAKSRSAWSVRADDLGVVDVGCRAVLLAYMLYSR
jgi:hypothetical protein